MLAKAALVCAGLTLSGAIVFQNPQVLIGGSGSGHSCLSRGLEVDGKPFVSHGCFGTDVNAKAVWKQNIRFLTEAFHAIDHLQCEPLTRSAEDYRDSGSEEDRHALLRDLNSLSALLRLAAETAHRNSVYLPETASRSHDLERNYLWAAALLEGPLSWTLPADQAGMQNWVIALRSLIQGIRPTFAEHHALTKGELEQCDPAEDDHVVASLD